MDLSTLILILTTILNVVSGFPRNLEDRTTAADPDPASLTPLFVVKTGDESVSGCDNGNRVPDLRAAYTQAIAMVQRAVAAIANLETGDPEDDQALWDRQFLYLRELFAVRMGEDGFAMDPGPHELMNGDEAFVQVKKHFKDILTYVYNHNSPVHGYVACGDAGITYIGPNDKVEPTDDQTLNEMENGKFPNGAWYITGDDASFPEILFDAPIDEDTHAVLPKSQLFCGSVPGGKAFTFYTSVPIIVFCDAAFDLPITTAQIPGIIDGRSLSRYETLSKSWVHELAHAWSQGIVDDQVAVDPEPSRLIAPVQDASGKWTVSPKDPTGHRAYGMIAAILLAENYPDQAVLNADNYAYFSLALWIDNWNWPSGLATQI